MNTKLYLNNIRDLPILVTLDACHLIKLVQNTLGDFRVIKNSENETISWHYFKSLHNLQQREGLHLANSLRSKHINWQANKMKVKLAVETLSTLVANSVDYCQDVLKDKEFSGIEATTE